MRIKTPKKRKESEFSVETAIEKIPVKLEDAIKAIGAAYEKTDKKLEELVFYCKDRNCNGR